MEERLQLVSMHRTGWYRVTELAAHFTVSRKTAHKWLARFAEGGVAALEERSRAPHEHPNATPSAVVEAVLRAKAAHPTWGPAKLSSQDPRSRPRWPRHGPCRAPAGRSWPATD